MTYKTKEQLHGPHLRGPATIVTSPDARGVFMGVETIASGSVTQVVSTTEVVSGDWFNISVQISSADAGVNSGGFVAVNSIVDNTSFALTWATGVAVPQDAIVSWELRHR